MHSVDSRIRQLDAFFKRSCSESITEEYQSDLAKLGAILICGFVERCVEIVILDRLSHLAHQRVIRFIKGHFQRGTNYNCEAISQLLDRFDPIWAKKFSERLSNNQRLSESIKSAYTLRNSIAHGGSENRGIRGTIDLYDAAKMVVDVLIESTK